MYAVSFFFSHPPSQGSRVNRCSYGINYFLLGYIGPDSFVVFNNNNPVVEDWKVLIVKWLYITVSCRGFRIRRHLKLVARYTSLALLDSEVWYTES